MAAGDACSATSVWKSSGEAWHHAATCGGEGSGGVLPSLAAAVLVAAAATAAADGGSAATAPHVARASADAMLTGLDWGCGLLRGVLAGSASGRGGLAPEAAVCNG